MKSRESINSAHLKEIVRLQLNNYCSALRLCRISQPAEKELLHSFNYFNSLPPLDSLNSTKNYLCKPADGCLMICAVDASVPHGKKIFITSLKTKKMYHF